MSCSNSAKEHSDIQKPGGGEGEEAPSEEVEERESPLPPLEGGAFSAAAGRPPVSAPAKRCVPARTHGHQVRAEEEPEQGLRDVRRGPGQRDERLRPRVAAVADVRHAAQRPHAQLRRGGPAEGVRDKCVARLVHHNGREQDGAVEQEDEERNRQAEVEKAYQRLHGEKHGEECCAGKGVSETQRS